MNDLFVNLKLELKVFSYIQLVINSKEFLGNKTYYRSGAATLLLMLENYAVIAVYKLFHYYYYYQIFKFFPRGPRIALVKFVQPKMDFGPKRHFGMRF